MLASSGAARGGAGLDQKAAGLPLGGGSNWLVKGMHGPFEKGEVEKKETHSRLALLQQKGLI